MVSWRRKYFDTVKTVIVSLIIIIIGCLINIQMNFISDFYQPILENSTKACKTDSNILNIYLIVSVFVR